MKLFRMVICLCGLLIALLPTAVRAAEKCRVLVVMSYEETFPWDSEQKEGVDSVLAERCEVKYFYMDTKHNFLGGAEKAREAFKLYEAFKPHGVIAADDDAQAMFVVPYLRDKVTTPVMFCGVNAAAEKYGYPASNVSGILERFHIAESIALARQLVPGSKSIAFMIKQSPVANFVREQVLEETSSYPVKVNGVKMPATLAEALAMATELRKNTDLLFMVTLEGITDDNGAPLKDREAIPLVARAFGKATISGNEYAIRYSLLTSVVRTGQEQGATAARMLQQAMDGTPVAKIPITKNHNGKRVINLTVMKELGITPKPFVLRGVELVTTEVQ